MHTFSISESIRFGWETFKKRPWFFIWTLFVFNMLAGLNFQSEKESAADMHMQGLTIAVGVAVAIGFAVISVIAKMALNRFLLRAHEAPESVGFKESWKLEKFWRFLGASILKGAIIGLPAVALVGVAFVSYPNWAIVVLAVVLAIAWAAFMGIKYLFVELIVMDTDLSAVQCLRESEKVTRGEFWHLVGFSLAVAGVCILGLLALIVGLLVAVPVTMFAYVHVYKKLKARAAASA